MKDVAAWALAALLGLALASLPWLHFGAGHASHGSHGTEALDAGHRHRGSHAD